VHYEYLIFNILVIAGPLIFGLFRPFYFVDKWLPALVSAAVVGFPYIIWDALVTGQHWTFNADYITGVYISGLPVEEWLFFFTVPFACLFTWEMISLYTTEKRLGSIAVIRPFLYILPLLGILLFARGLEYTGLVFIVTGIAILADRILKTDLLLSRRFYLYIGLVILFTVVFNGFLTARPVVLYGESYQLGLRIITIPIEDFGYGISLIFLNTSVFIKLKQSRFVQAALQAK